MINNLTRWNLMLHDAKCPYTDHNNLKTIYDQPVSLLGIKIWKSIGTLL